MPRVLSFGDAAAQRQSVTPPARHPEVAALVDDLQVLVDRPVALETVVELAHRLAAEIRAEASGTD
jgi:hypothetical protein